MLAAALDVIGNQLAHVAQLRLSFMFPTLFEVKTTLYSHLVSAEENCLYGSDGLMSEAIPSSVRAMAGYATPGVADGAGNTSAPRIAHARQR